MSIFGILVTIICNLKIDRIMTEPRRVKFFFGKPPFIVQLCEILTFCDIIDYYVIFFWTHFGILT